MPPKRRSKRKHADSRLDSETRTPGTLNNSTGAHEDSEQPDSSPDEKRYPSDSPGGHEATPSQWCQHLCSDGARYVCVNCLTTCLLGVIGKTLTLWAPSVNYNPRSQGLLSSSGSAAVVHRANTCTFVVPLSAPPQHMLNNFVNNGNLL